MRIRQSILSTYVADPRLKNGASGLREVAEALSLSGLEARAVPLLSEPISGVVVGEVLEAKPHPNADRLRVCQVSDGTDVFTVVCGAPNARAGIKVAFSKVGAKLPFGVKIRASKIRDVSSEGMLCSGRELRLSEESDGILELPSTLPLGMDFVEAMGLGESLLEVEVTPNRGDCLSVLGVAREIAALSGEKLILPSTLPVKPELPSGPKVTLEAATRAFGSVLLEISSVSALPPLMEKLLLDNGFRPKSPLVDLTNALMLLLGQPLHAYDADLLKGDLSVRWAREGEKITLLNAQEVALSGSHLVVCDAAGPVGLAGIMGGARTAVSERTTRVLLEAAHFEPSAIKNRARALKLSSEASARFERGVDPELPRVALEQALSVLSGVAVFKSGPVQLIQGPPKPSDEIPLEEGHLKRVLGRVFSVEEVESSLASLGFSVRVIERSPWRIEARAPSHRFDVSMSEDLIEEIIRVRGLSLLPPEPFALKASFEPGRLLRARASALFERAVRLSSALGYLEVMNYSFISREDEALFVWEGEDAPVHLLNPMDQTQDRLRRSLLPSLMRLSGVNFSYQEEVSRLFELARTYTQDADGQPRERLRLAFLWAEGREKFWNAAQGPSLSLLKDEMASLLRSFALEARFAPLEPSPSFLHPKAALGVYLGKREVGLLGQVHPSLKKYFDFPLHSKAFVAELDFDAVVSSALHTQSPKLRPVSKQPVAKRDYSLLVPKERAYSEILAVATSTLGAWLLEVRPFDLYEEASLPEGMFGLSVRLRFQGEEITHEKLLPFLEKFEQQLLELGIQKRA